MGFTRKDIESARRYVNYRTLLNARNACIRDAPHIFSHTVLNIEAATLSAITDSNDDDGNYVFEKYFADKALKARWSFNETGCATTSCFPTYPLSETCKEDSVPFSFGTPNGSLFDACQPSCFNSKLTPESGNAASEDETARRLPPQLIWFKDSCLLENYALTSFFLDPSKHHENGKIDVTNFDIYVAEIGADKNPAICARINPRYCESFYTDFIKDYDESALLDDKACGYDGGTYYLQLFIGSSLIKLVRMSESKFRESVEIFKREILKNGGRAEVPVFLRHDQPTRDFLRSVKKWKSNINATKKTVPEDVTLSELGIIDGGRDRLMWTDKFSHLDDGRNDKYGGRLIEKSRGIPISIRLNNDENNSSENKVPKRIVEEILVPAGKRVRRQLMNSDDVHQLSENELLDTIQKVIFGIGGMLSKENITETSLQLGADGGVTVFKYYMKTLGPRLVNAFLKSELLAAGRSVSAKLFSTVVSHAMFNLIAESVVMHLGKAAIALMGVASSALTIIGWLLAIGPIMDLLFAFVWDPFDFSTPTLSDSLLRKISESGLMQRQVDVGSRRIEMSPYTFWHLHVVNDDFKYENEYAACALKHTLVYFSNRKISSDGSAIDWSRDDDDSIVFSNETGRFDYGDNGAGKIKTTNVRVVFRQLLVRNMMHGFEDARFFHRRIRNRSDIADITITGTMVGIIPTIYLATGASGGIYSVIFIFLVVVNVLAITTFRRVFGDNGSAAAMGKAPRFSSSKI